MSDINNKLNDTKVQDLEALISSVMFRPDRIEQIKRQIAKAIYSNQSETIINKLKSELKDEKSKLTKETKCIEKLQKEIRNTRK